MGADTAASVVACAACGRRNRVAAVAAGSPRCAQCKRPLPWVADALDATFAEVAERSTIPVVVDIWAPWCGPCRAVGPVLEDLAREFAGRCKLVKINADAAPGTARRLGAQAIPTIVLLDGGREVARQVGAAPAHQMREWLLNGLDTARPSSV
jgi:thioredoxin 2